jgi:hypothetical protein
MGRNSNGFRAFNEVRRGPSAVKKRGVAADADRPRRDALSLGKRVIRTRAVLDSLRLRH